MTTNQKLQVAHEIRMWCIGLLIPVAGTIIVLSQNQKVRAWIKDKKEKIASRKRK